MTDEDTTDADPDDTTVDASDGTTAGAPDDDPAEGRTAGVVDADADWDAAVDLRTAVFVDEQGVPEELELDEHDEDPLGSDVDHLLVRAADGEPVAVARLRAVDGTSYGFDDGSDAGNAGDAGDGGDASGGENRGGTRNDAAGEGGAALDRVAKVERVAVACDRRGAGWGARVMDAAESRARERGLPAVVLHAQTTASGFYERLGYAVDDARGTFDEDGIEHVRMRKRL